MNEQNKFGGGDEELDALLDEEEFVEEEMQAGDTQVYFDQPPADAEVIGVRFSTSAKIYYFNPAGKNYPEGCHAIVETARGQEYGLVAQGNHIVSGREIILPLRSAIRVATPADDERNRENRRKAEDAFLVGNRKIEEHGLGMKLIDCEYTFDNSKLLFYFTSEGRVDFRDLVKDLASVFHCRIELRQMGIRDEAKILGGLGICGRPFCCHAFLPDFVQVSIKMAKEQNLALNSAKISGACGRLMCCLRYEYDAYLEEGRLTPKVDSLVNTPDGIGVVTESKPLTGMVKVKSLDDTAGTPRVYHRDQLTPIRKGDENYERAAAEKNLEKQARAAGTTRAALKAAMNETPEKAAERLAREERLARVKKEEPKKAASYTGQVVPLALQPASKDAGAGSKEEQTGKEDGDRQRPLHKAGRGSGRRGSRKEQIAVPAELSAAEKNGRAPRFEKTRAQNKTVPSDGRRRHVIEHGKWQDKKAPSAPSAPSVPTPPPASSAPPVKPDGSGEKASGGRHRRPFRRNRNNQKNSSD